MLGPVDAQDPVGQAEYKVEEIDRAMLHPFLEAETIHAFHL